MSEHICYMSTASRDYLLQCERALLAIHDLAREGHGPVFTQKAVAVGQRAAMGTGDTLDEFAAAVIALGKTTHIRDRLADADARSTFRSGA